MAKYSFELKQKVVQEYLAGEGSYIFLSKKYGISDDANLKRWVAAYKAFGTEGLMPSCKNEIYSFDFKQHVVQSYLATGTTFQELALRVGINNPSLLSRWVRDFKNAGPDALKPKQKGQHSNMAKSKDIRISMDRAEISDSEYLKYLEDENQKLRIENAYLKELRRLRLEGIPQSEKRESSTASEENSN